MHTIFCKLEFLRVEMAGSESVYIACMDVCTSVRRGDTTGRTNEWRFHVWMYVWMFCCQSLPIPSLMRLFLYLPEQ